MEDLEKALANARGQWAESSNLLTDRTRGLMDTIKELTTEREQAKPTTRRTNADHAAAKAASNEPDPRAAATSEAVEAALTPRLMELLGGGGSGGNSKPEPADVADVHQGLESLQSTLGAAYMLLAAEAKAETLQAELSEARGDLAFTLGSSEELLAAHERCVTDYSELRGVIESARDEAEALAKALAAEAGAPPTSDEARSGPVWGGGARGRGASAETRQLCSKLLETLGSSMTLEPSAADEAQTGRRASSGGGSGVGSGGGSGGGCGGGSGRSGEGAAESLRRKLREAEEHQKSVAASLHSREAQLALVRQELQAVAGEKERYADIVSDASAKLAAAAGTPGDRTARSVGRRSMEAETAAQQEEAKLEELLAQCQRAAMEWHAAESAHDAAAPAASFDGFTIGGNEENQSRGAQLQQHGNGGSSHQHGGSGAAGAGSAAASAAGHGAHEPSRKTSSKQRRLARQAAVQEVKRILQLADAEAKKLRPRREEQRSISNTLREMLSALELERTARIRLQELLARDWTAQASSLTRCFHEQDVVLEVALHKLEVHGGAELANALSFQMQALRARMAELLEEEASAAARRRTGLLSDPKSNAAGTPVGAGKRRSSGGNGGAGSGVAVPEALASALSSVSTFFAGKEGRGRRRRNAKPGPWAEAAAEMAAGVAPTTAAVWSAAPADAADGEERMPFASPLPGAMPGTAEAAAAEASFIAPNGYMAAKGAEHAAGGIFTSPAAAKVAREAAEDVEKLGDMARSVLEHLQGRLSAAAKQAVTGA